MLTKYPHLHNRILKLALEAEELGFIDCCLPDHDDNHYLLSVDGVVYRLKDISTGVVLHQFLKIQDTSFLPSLFVSNNNSSDSVSLFSETVDENVIDSK